MTLHLVHFVEGFAGFVLVGGKGGNCLLVEIVMREVLMLAVTVAGLVAGTRLSLRQLYRNHLLVGPRGTVLVAEIVAVVGLG